MELLTAQGRQERRKGELPLREARFKVAARPSRVEGVQQVRRECGTRVPLRAVLSIQ